MAWTPSYASLRKQPNVWTYDLLVEKVLPQKSTTIKFLMAYGVLKNNQNCPKCHKEMTLTKCSAKDFIEELCFRCQKRHLDRDSGTLKSHNQRLSIKKGSLFHDANLNLAEAIKVCLIYAGHIGLFF